MARGLSEEVIFKQNWSEEKNAPSRSRKSRGPVAESTLGTLEKAQGSEQTLLELSEQG